MGHGNNLGCCCRLWRFACAALCSVLGPGRSGNGSACALCLTRGATARATDGAAERCCLVAAPRAKAPTAQQTIGAAGGSPGAMYVGSVQLYIQVFYGVCRETTRRLGRAAITNTRAGRLGWWWCCVGLCERVKGQVAVRHRGGLSRRLRSWRNVTMPAGVWWRRLCVGFGAAGIRYGGGGAVCTVPQSLARCRGLHPCVVRW